MTDFLPVCQGTQSSLLLLRSKSALGLIAMVTCPRPARPACTSVKAQLTQKHFLRSRLCFRLSTWPCSLHSSCYSSLHFHSSAPVLQGRGVLQWVLCSRVRLLLAHYVTQHLCFADSFGSQGQVPFLEDSQTSGFLLWPEINTPKWQRRHTVEWGMVNLKVFLVYSLSEAVWLVYWKSFGSSEEGVIHLQKQSCSSLGFRSCF